MTRWCAYATLALAIVCCTVSRAESSTHTTEHSVLAPASRVPSSALRKRTSNKPIARRDARGSSMHAIVPDAIDLVTPRIPVVERRAAAGNRRARRPIAAAARDPPRP